MNRIKRIVPSLCAGAVGLLGTATCSMASVDLTNVELDTTSPETLAATVLAGLGIMWGIRKLIKLINRS